MKKWTLIFKMLVIVLFVTLFMKNDVMADDYSSMIDNYTTGTDTSFNFRCYTEFRDSTLDEYKLLAKRASTADVPIPGMYKTNVAGKTCYTMVHHKVFVKHLNIG